LAYGGGQQYALIRDDGLILARYPVAPPGASDRLGENTGFRRMAAQSPHGGVYTSTSPIDHIERRFAYRRLLIAHSKVHLLLTDVVMPGMNGRKLAEEAKRQQPFLKVLCMTGYSRNAIVHQGWLEPGVDLVQKPLTSEQLAIAIRNMLDS
jgi:CheY-like chemotaxis protein